MNYAVSDRHSLRFNLIGAINNHAPTIFSVRKDLPFLILQALKYGNSKASVLGT
jgi:hypothetical protein